MTRKGISFTNRVSALRVLGAFVALILAGVFASACKPVPTQTPAPTKLPLPTEEATSQREVFLTMGSWRKEDVLEMVYILDKFQEQYPHITIKFDPTLATEYNAALEAQLKGETAPDLFYLRSYSTSQQLYEQGYLEPLDDLSGLQDRFDPTMLDPWTGDDGVHYGVPYIATSHGIYYNVSIFEDLGLDIPQTWEQLLAVSNELKTAGITPFANAAGDGWTIAEIVFMNIAPNFIGGREGRLAYLGGERCFNDEYMVSAFQAVADLAEYLPDNHSMLTYADSQQLFLQGQAAMWMGGSWDIPFFNSSYPAFEWSIFPPPPPEGQPAYVTFHLDAGMGLNAASKNKAAAKLFLEWMTTPEFATLMGNALPGFFPMSKNVPPLENKYANTFLEFSLNQETDVRFTWELLMEGDPSAYDLVRDNAVAVITGSKTPEEAAASIQSGLETWFVPAQNCMGQ